MELIDDTRRFYPRLRFGGVVLALLALFLLVPTRLVGDAYQARAATPSHMLKIRSVIELQQTKLGDASRQYGFG